MKIHSENSVRDALSSRATCRQLRDTVDENERVISRRLHARETDLLVAWIDYYFHFDVDEVSFVESIRRWFAGKPLSIRRLASDGAPWKKAHVPYAVRAAERLEKLHGHLNNRQNYRKIHKPLAEMVQMMTMLYAGSRNGRPPNRQSLKNLYNRLAYPSYTNLLQPFVDVGILDFAETWHAMVERATSMVPAEPANMVELEQEARKLTPITAINWRKHFELGLGRSVHGEKQIMMSSYRPPILRSARTNLSLISLAYRRCPWMMVWWRIAFEADGSIVWFSRLLKGTSGLCRKRPSWSSFVFADGVDLMYDSLHSRTQNTIRRPCATCSVILLAYNASPGGGQWL